MKKSILGLMSAVFMLGMFTSCSDDDPKPNPEPNPEPPTPVVVPGESLTAKEYKGEAAVITVGETAQTGKLVKFTPKGDSKAEITLEGEALNLTDLIAGASSKADDNTLLLPTPGVIPGSPSVTIPVTLEGTADDCTFKGSGDTEYCTFNYTGSVNADKLTFSLTDVKLKNASIAGTYNLNPFKKDDSDGGNIYRMARIVWDSEKQFDIELFPGYNMQMPIQTIISMALIIPTLGDDGNGNPTSAVCDMLQAALKSVTFTESGDLTASYAEIKDDGSLATEFTESPAGMVQYVVKDDNTLLLFLNPQDIIANTLSRAEGTGADIDAIVASLINDVLPMCANGVPVHYGPAILVDENDPWADPAPSENPADVSFYIGDDVLLPILKTVSPILSDQEVINAIVGAAQQAPGMESMAAMLEPMLKQLPEVIEKTNKIEIGINFTKQ